MTAAWHFYHLATGVFLPSAMLLPNRQAVERNTPAGHIALWGDFDHLAQRVDVDAATDPPTIVDYRPPAPAASELEEWRWDEGSCRWLSAATPAAIALQARGRRDQLLAASDWVALRAMEQGAPLPPAWASYRAALRDLTDQAGFPSLIAWPTAPAG